MQFEEILNGIHASWLAKLIGIRLGAPIEAWSGPEVRNLYQPIQNYLTDYGQFAADDDSNGPLFFSSVMETYDLETITSQAMAENLLNVVGQNKGFFWWGGKGISTEETAYENLINGIPAGQSGSCNQNGKATAEQIGGQIFSDCWGYLAIDKPEIACMLAEKMSKITHDGDGIEGGKFVAVCISLAWHIKDCKTLICEAIKYLNPQSTYVKLIQEIIAFYEEYPNNAEACLAYIETKHSYDHYEGLCHILPNTAIMLYGMLYGKNDFDTTMRLIAEAGRDTDCNLGNVGSILGMMVGLDGISEKWIQVMNDVLICSSAIGSKNITTITHSAKYFAMLACQLAKIDYPKISLGKWHSDFFTPYSTNGFFLPNNRYQSCSLRTQDKKLKLCLSDLYENQTIALTKKTYFKPEELYDCRYEPQFAALIEPGDTIRFQLEDPESLALEFACYVKGYSGKIYQSSFSTDLNRSFIPMEDDVPYCECGILIRNQQRIQRKHLLLHSFEIIKSPDVMIDFSKLSEENWGYDFINVPHYGISGLRIHEGNAVINENGLRLDAHSSFNISGPSIDTHKLSLSFEPTQYIDLHLAYCWKGCFDYQSIHIKNHQIFSYTIKERVITEELIDEIPPNTTELKIDTYMAMVIAVADGINYQYELDNYLPQDIGCIGICNHADTPIQLKQLAYIGKRYE